MLPSRCTALVLGAALALALPAVLAAGEADPAVPEPVAAPKGLAEYGIATYQLVPQARPEVQLWRLFGAERRLVATLEHRPAEASPAPGAFGGDTYVLTFEGDVLVAHTGAQRSVFQLNDNELVAWAYDAKAHRFVMESPKGEAAFEAMRPRVRLLNALVNALLPEPPAADGAKGGGAVERPEEASCTGQQFSDHALGVTRSRACSRVTALLNNSCSAASTGACVGCCFLSECDCACVPETDFDCVCIREGRSCAPGCPPANPPPGGCGTQHCGVNCYERALAAVPGGHRVIGGACNFSNECRCDAWVNTCDPADGSRHTFYSGVQECPDPCPPGTPCGATSCSGSSPQCCLGSFCAPSGSDCCTDGGTCPSGWHCCDDGTGTCCPYGYRCCWLDFGPACCGWSADDDTSLAEPSGPPLYTTPRRLKNEPAAPPQSPKE
jgi:hypothetical protein